MRLKCLHGYFIITEDRVGEAADFMYWSGLELVPVNDYYTFKSLEFAPDYSLAGKPILDYPAAIKTFEGQPWEVFEANGIIYDFSLDLIVPILAVSQVASIKQTVNFYFSPGLLKPGSIIGGLNRVKDYAAYWSKESLNFRYSDLTYV